MNKTPTFNPRKQIIMAKIKLLTPEERQEWTYLKKHPEKDLKRWAELCSKAADEHYQNMTPEEQKVWDEMDARKREKEKMHWSL